MRVAEPSTCGKDGKAISSIINHKSKIGDQVSPVKSVSLLFFETPVKQKQLIGLTG
jgi:hypothetical protein